MIFECIVKNHVMKNLIAIMFLLASGLTLSAQQLQTASTKGAVRLFGDKDDLTTVVTLIPDGSIVEVIRADSVYTLIRFDGNEGYVKSDRLGEVAAAQTASEPLNNYAPATYDMQTGATYQPDGWYQTLVARYGADTGKQLYQHKVWKGISADMARDSWGKPKQINRMYVDQSVDEEWIYSKKWLYFKDGVLTEWGPVKN